ncbi:TRPM8 channel-associated factor homolog [Xenentodon cancila]
MANQPTQSYHEGAYRFLMRGLTGLDLQCSSVPCNLVLAGENAFPLLINSHGHVLMAASLYGRGRIVVLSHETYLFRFPALVENAINWLRGESGNFSVGLQQNLNSVADHLDKSVFQVSVVKASVKIQATCREFQDDLEFLLKGISGFDLQGDFCASAALVHGPLAFPIGTTTEEHAFLAGTYYGQGRVIVASHETLIQLETLAPFWKNAFDWLDQGRKGVVGFAPGIDILTNLELKCEATDFRKDLSVFVRTAYNDEHIHKIQSFVAEGGGLVVGGHAWYWAQTHFGQNPLQDFPGNKLLNKMGLSLSKKTIKNSFYKPPATNQTRHSHFRYLLSRFIVHVTEGKGLTEQEERRLKKLRLECASFLNMKAYHSLSYMQVLSILTDTFKKTGMPLDALLPYLIKDNPPLPVVYNQRIKIKNREWISTGLYLFPGQKTYMILPATFMHKKWKILIGCQSDKLDAEMLKRAPRVTKNFPVTSEMMQVWNLWGGLIYLEAPRDINVEEEEVVVQVAVSAPYYKSGVTTADEWSVLRAAPSPWAELEFDNIVLSVPSHIVRDLQHPDEVAKLWNDIMQGVADLAVIDKFERKERIVADVQISAGWMHSGYPIMMHSSIAAELVRPEDARTKGLWGETHELGHNQQRSCWEFPPHTGEATCNLWSVYVHEEVLGLNRAKAHPEMTLETRKKCVQEYVQSGRNLDNWKVWTALETYLQLQEKFGWDAFKKVFAAYHGMGDLPKDNNGKMNLYAETFSRTVGMNLTGFFKAWGWPIEEATEEKLSGLPPWTDHPMVQYD